MQILDHATRDELIKKYQGHNVNLDNIEEVDFIWCGESYQELIGKIGCYDWIIASHVIEHVPDLISFLQQCEELLKPAGILSLVIPDKRYCFDYFSASSSTGNVLDAYTEKRVRPSNGQVFDHFANSVKINGKNAWSSAEGKGVGELCHTFGQARKLWGKSISTTDYIDAHCWKFTPASFHLIISDLQRLGLVGLEVKAEFDTAGCEFFVSLGKKCDAPLKLDRLTALQTIKFENA